MYHIIFDCTTLHFTHVDSKHAGEVEGPLAGDVNHLTLQREAMGVVQEGAWGHALALCGEIETRVNEIYSSQKQSLGKITVKH